MARANISKTQLEAEPIKGVSSTLLTFRQEYSDGQNPPLIRWQAGNHTFELRSGGQSLWIKVLGPNGMKVALRAGYCLDGEFDDFQFKKDDRSAEFWLTQSSGKYRLRVELPDSRTPLIHWTLWFTPSESIRINNWPRDVYPLGEDDDPMTSRGDIHLTQHGPRSGLLYFTMLKPAPGSVLYFQNLTAINDYSEKTHTAPTDRVSGEWPELGYAPALATNAPLPADQEVIISDAFVCFSKTLPRDDIQTSQLFLDLLAQVYLQIPRPEVEYHHWLDRVDRVLWHLTHSPLCTREIDGKRYVNPYVGASDKPPESLVQLSVLVALSAYAEWKGTDLTLAKELNASLPGFYEPNIQSFSRWLVGATFNKDQWEDNVNAESTDSWYLYHSLADIGYLAKHKDPVAKQLFLKSLDYAIKVAHRFDYQWPVFFHAQTLEIIRGETSPGAGGENDVPGLYCRVMLLAYDLTGDRKYIKEAEQAARRLQGLGFNLAYQLNNTVMGAVSLLQLWKETGDEYFKNLSYVNIANLFSHVWLWDCKYGNAKYYSTFFGILPLKDAPYLALFEEFEVPSILDQYLSIGGDALPKSVQLLIAELMRYSLSRAWQYYPSELPREIVAEKPDTGQIEYGLDIPLEDFYEGWQKPGQVGQEVYGAGAPFTFVARHYHQIPDAPFLVFCDYPVTQFSVKQNRQSTTVAFNIGGDKRMPCRVRLTPTTPQRLSSETTQLHRLGRKQPARGQLTPEGHLDFELRGDEQIYITYTSKRAPKITQRKSKSTRNRKKAY
jgi:hypothetical protein